VEEVAEALQEYRHCRGMRRQARSEPDFEPETAA
jgi:hypothetical protein